MKRFSSKVSHDDAHLVLRIGNRAAEELEARHLDTLIDNFSLRGSTEPLSEDEISEDLARYYGGAKEASILSRFAVTTDIEHLSSYAKVTIERDPEMLWVLLDRLNKAASFCRGRHEAGASSAARSLMKGYHALVEFAESTLGLMIVHKWGELRTVRESAKMQRQIEEIKRLRDEHPFRNW